MSGEARKEPVRLGGQAVIEGVMIKGSRHAAVAVRAESGEVKLTRRQFTPRRRPPYTWPIFRGLVVFWQTLAIGFWALDVSAREAAGEGDEKGGAWMGVLSAVLGLAAGLALFFWLPLVLAQLARGFFGILENELAFNLLDGFIRLGVFVLYVVVIGLMPGIRRVFEYHGAEHKVVHAWEREGRADPASAAGYSPLHPRCGTAFLLTVMVVSILFFSLIPHDQPFLVKLGGRLVLLPLIAGISFEVIRLADRSGNRLLRWMLAPGLWLQKLTTREPDTAQTEVAAAALAEVLRLEGLES